MKTQVEPQSDAMIIATALKRAAIFMGINNKTLAEILKIDASTLSRSLRNGIEPNSLKGEVCILLIRMYRSLFALSGNDDGFIRHFLNSDNYYFGQKPIEAIKTLEGLLSVNQYLDAMRGKT